MDGGGGGGTQPPPRHMPRSHAGGTGLSTSIPGGGGSDPDLHGKGLRVGVEKVKRMIANLTYVEMSVVKATAPTDGPPKRKHTRRLVDESWKNPRTAPIEAMNALSRCPMLNSAVVTLKTLCTVHELMQKGAPAVLPAAHDWREHFMLVQSHWGPDQMGSEFGLAQVCGPLITRYAKMLHAKAQFHAEFRRFENNYSFDSEKTSDGSTPPAVSRASLNAMLTLERTCRGALDVVAQILPRDPPLAALQWHRLVAHVGKLVAVEAHLLHGAAVYIAATLADEVDAGRSGLPSAEARRLEGEHKALRMTFTEARARPAMMTAFVEEGGDPALPPGWLGEGGGGDGFRFLELPEMLPSFDSEEGRAAMASMIASSFGPPSSHTRPPPEPEERGVTSPFDEYPSDDELGVNSPDAGEKVPRMVIDLPPLIDFTADDDDWVPPKAIMAPPPPRPPLFGGYGAAPAAPAPPAAAAAGTGGFRPAAASGTVVAAGRGAGDAAGTGILSISGRPTAKGPSNHSRHQSRENVLDINASLAAFELTAVRPREAKETNVDGAAPQMFADLAPAGVSSVRPPPAPPVSMIAQRSATGPAPRFPTRQTRPQPAPPQPPQQQPMRQHHQSQQQPWMQPHGQWTQPAASQEGWAKFDDPPAPAPPATAPPAPPAPPPRAPPPAPAPPSPAPAPLVSPAMTPILSPNDHPVPLPQREQPRGVGGHAVATFDEIPISEIQFGRRIGTGAFGEVLKANYQGTDVAVKRLRLDPSQPQAAEDFRRELRVLCGLRHRHVVQFLGACTTGPDLCLVMDFCGFGSLYGVLHNRRQHITAAHVLRWMADTARGMVYLHSRNIIHRDIKSGNLLLNDSGVVKVADFGLARAHGPTSNLLTLVGTYPYMAPELLDSQPYNSSVDVYSFGVVMWECLTRDEPFRGLSPMQIVATLLRGERPKLPASPALPQSYVQLLTECWATQPERRPTFAAALDRLLGIAHAMKAAEVPR